MNTASIPASREVTASSARSVFVDPKTGKTLWTANVESASASTSASGSVMGVMEGVDGIFYQQGKPADHFSAPKVIYDEHAQTVTASGGVKLKSLTQNNTTLSCDSLVWYPGTGKLVGSGNVVYHSGHFMQTGPSFQADTKLKRITMHRTASQPIHIVYQP